MPPDAALLAAIAVLAAASASATPPFPEPYNSEPEDAQPPSPEAARDLLRLPEGFQATVFASEPELQNPIAANWDHRGRLWVAENFTFAELGKRFDMELRDRVLILEDSNGDGRADRRKVFTDQVQKLTSVEVGRGGVWLMCPPRLLFVPDADGDDVPDGEPEVVLDGFTVAQDNYHNFANGLRWGPDGWLYGRCGHACPGNIGTPGTPEEQRLPIKGGIWRYHPQRKTVEVIAHGTTNPWGHDWDEHGEGFFINVVNGHLWHLIHGAHYKESYGASLNPHVYERIDTHADHWHFDTNKAWQDSRDGRADDYGGGHAHVGMMIYQADQWPESDRGKLFTLNLHGRRTNVERLERHGSGFIGRHEPDRFLTEDKWFRGIDITTGPDGAGYLLDWSDTGECHDHTGVHRTSGRIFKLTHGTPQPPELGDLTSLTADGVERIIRHPNTWYERQLRVRLLSTTLPQPVLDRLWEIAADPAETASHRLRALWACHLQESAGPQRLSSLLADPNEHLRAWAIRLLTDAGLLDTMTGKVRVARSPIDAEVHAKFVTMAGQDESGLVRLALASALQRLPLEERAEIATALVGDPTYATDHNLPPLIWFGLIPLAEAEPQRMANIAAACTWPDSLRWISRHAASRMESDPQSLTRLLDVGIDQADPWKLSVVRGISEGLAGWKEAPRPQRWTSFTASLARDPDEETAKLLRELAVVFGENEALDQLKAIARDGTADLARRQEAMRSLIDARPPDLRELAETLLKTPGLAGVAAAGMAHSEDPEIGRLLTRCLTDLAPAERSAVVDVLVQRPAWAAHLLEHVRKGSIPREAIAAHQARQIQALEVDALTEALTAVWGDLRKPTTEKTKALAGWKTRLSPDALAQADLSKGKALYASLCASCHQLYGSGGTLGPDLTGSGRANLDYLLENILDPNAVVAVDQRMTLLTLHDGRVLAGAITAETDQTLTLRQPAGDTIVNTSDIAKRERSPLSMMPEGLLIGKSDEQVRDLIAYLIQPTDVPE